VFECGQAQGVIIRRRVVTLGKQAAQSRSALSARAFPMPRSPRFGDRSQSAERHILASHACAAALWDTANEYPTPLHERTSICALANFFLSLQTYT
jgi:hypothetical protein